MKFRLRPIKDSDLLFLKKVYRSTRKPELDITGWTEEEKAKFIDFQFNAQHSHYTSAYKGAEFNIIEWNKKDIGRLYIWDTENQIRIMDIVILEEFRNKGFGTEILNILIKKSNDSGKKLNIHVEHNNPALTLYNRLEFKKTDDTGIYYFMERFPENKS